MIKEFVPPAPPQQEYPIQQSQQEQLYEENIPQNHSHYYAQSQPQIDLLEEWEEPPLASSQDSVVPPTSAPSAFGFIGASPAAAVAAPVPVAAPPAVHTPSAPPMTESGFGFLNTPAPAPQQHAPQPPLSSTSRPAHDRPLRVEDLATQSRGPSQSCCASTAAIAAVHQDIPTGSAFAFLAAPAPAPVATQSVPRPVDVWDALPAPTPTIGVAQPEPEVCFLLCSVLRRSIHLH